MKRLPIVLTLLALIALAASIAYWVLQLYKPQQRPIASAPLVAAAEPSIDAAATLFGGQAAAAVATNYQLTGVVAANGDSVAILAASGQPPKAVRVGKEVMPGVTLSEVHARYVMLSDGGVMKRIDLPADTKSGATSAAPTMPAAGMPPGGEPPLAPGAVAPAAANDPNLGIVSGPEEPAGPPEPVPDQPQEPGSNTAPGAPPAAAPGAPQTTAPGTQAVTPPVRMPAPVHATRGPARQPPVSR